MKIVDVMSAEPHTCRVQDRLDSAARILWEHDCGIVPVLDANGALAGVLTDRDVCMAAYTQGRPLHELGVATAMAKGVRTCRTDDTVDAALGAMRAQQVRRLPVLDEHGRLVGLVSITDLVRAAARGAATVQPAMVVDALAAIGAPRRAAPAAAPAQEKTVVVPAPPESAARAARPRGRAKAGAKTGGARASAAKDRRA